MDLQKNRKKGYSLAMNRVKNIKLGVELDLIINSMPIQDAALVMKFRSRLFSCASNSLYREHSTAATLVQSQKCKHKLCCICNSERKSKLRSIYVNYFKDNPDLMKEYSFMHLTLTVPHSVNGWRGKQVFNKELLEAFKYVRNKVPFWKNHVFAGQYSIEFTKGDNGLHIHLHALILVKKRVRRNYLYPLILKAWNNATIDDSSKLTWSTERIEGIRKSLDFLPNDQQNDVISELSEKGSTLVGLESVYHFEFIDGKFEKIYGKDEESILRGIIETLKYHFEPVCLEDISLVVELLPLIAKQRLYGRFGDFYNNKKLGLAFKNLENDEDEDDTVILDPITGEIDILEDYIYNIYDSTKVKNRKKDGLFTPLRPIAPPLYHIQEKDFKEAISVFSRYMVEKMKEEGREVKKEIEREIRVEKLLTAKNVSDEMAKVQSKGNAEKWENLYDYFND